MTRDYSRDAGRPLAAVLAKYLLPVLLLAVLAGLLMPLGMAIAPGFTGPVASPAPTIPAWQLPPTALAQPSAVAPLSSSAPVPDAAAVTRLIAPLLTPDGDGGFTGVVQDALTGAVLFDRGGDQNRVPASNTKLLTAVAALPALGPDAVFTTKVLAGGDGKTVVLTGGGDVLLGAGASKPEAVLGHAGLATLAEATVKALAARGVTGQITVQVDDSLYSGPALNPAWSPEDVAAGETAPLFPIALNSARTDPGSTTGPRPQDAALSAAQAFASQLATAGAASGLSVAPGVERGKGQPDTVLAAVESAPVSQQVDHMLQVSDNYLAETLGRMTAHVAGLPASNDGATAAVRDQLEKLGIATGKLQLADVSGLSLGNQVTALQFSEVVRAITSGQDTRLRAALAGFPVAGLSGTLGDRYLDAATAQGAGLVRAKTGTLNSVLALSGYVVDADGRLLVFSFIGNGLTPGAAGNKQALDKAASVLASCGCR